MSVPAGVGGSRSALQAGEIDACATNKGILFELARYMASESATWGKVVRERKISAE